MVNLVRVAHDQRNARRLRQGTRGRCVGLRVPRLAQPDGVVLERLYDLVDVAGRAAVAVFPLENRAHDLPRVRAPQRLGPAESIENEIRRVVVTRRQRRLVERVGNRASVVTLVELQASGVLRTHLRLRRECLIVGQTFEEQPERPQCTRVVAHALVERAAHSPAGLAAIRRDVLEIAEVQVRRMHEQREAANRQVIVLGHEQHATETMLERVQKLLRQLANLAFAQARKLQAQDRLHLRKPLAIGSRGGVIDPTNTEHRVPTDLAGAQHRPRATKSPLRSRCRPPLARPRNPHPATGRGSH